MDNFFQRAKIALSEELQRFRNRHFLEASMAASALLALADDEVQLSENLALDYILENMEEIKIFDVHKGVDLFQDYVEELKRNADIGKEKVFKIVGRFSGDDHAATLLIRACILIAKSDGELTKQEKETIEELCHILKLDTTKIGL